MTPKDGFDRALAIEALLPEDYDRLPPFRQDHLMRRAEWDVDHPGVEPRLPLEHVVSHGAALADMYVRAEFYAQPGSRQECAGETAWTFNVEGERCTGDPYDCHCGVMGANHGYSRGAQIAKELADPDMPEDTVTGIKIHALETTASMFSFTSTAPPSSSPQRCPPAAWRVSSGWVTHGRWQSRCATEDRATQ